MSDLKELAGRVRDVVRYGMPHGSAQVLETIAAELEALTLPGDDAREIWETEFSRASENYTIDGLVADGALSAMITRAAISAMTIYASRRVAQVTVDDDAAERALDAYHGPEWRGAPGPNLMRAEMKRAITAALQQQETK